MGQTHPRSTMDHSKLSHPEVAPDDKVRIPDPFSLTLPDEEATEFLKLT